MTKLSLIKVLDDLSKVRDILLSCKTRDEAIKSALDIVLKRLHPQTAAIFLFSKDGHLVRAGIKGTDLNDKPIDNNWFPQESYKVGESFTGRVVLPATDDSRYGKPQWFDDLGNEHLNDKSKSEYLSKLGEIKFVIGVPLNSQNRTYGVLEVINKLNRNDQGLTSFGTEEIYWLAAIGANLATSISNLRRNSQIRMLTEIGNLLVETPVDKNSIFRSVCEEIANKLLNPNTSFKVCVIHGGVKPDPLRVLAKAKVEGVTWKGRKDGKREYGTGFVGRAADSGEHIIVKRISEDIDKFYNQKWIKDNHLDSCACLPLVAKGKVVGTISLFAGYNYTFHEDIINLLQSVASLIASFALRAMASEEVKKKKKQLREERNARFISGYSLSREDILHEYKNELLVLQNVFREIKENTSKRELEKTIHSQMEWIEQRVNDIQNQFEEYLPEPVSINLILQDLVKYFSYELRSESKSIRFSQSYDRQIPRIMANPVEIKEVIRNLISNSIKAIQKAGRGGEIKLATNTVVAGGIDYIQAVIEDDGVGIRNEIKDKIYEKGFTTYKSEGGTGVGLFVVGKIVKKYGGRCFHKSIVGKGTQFFVRFPLRLREE